MDVLLPLLLSVGLIVVGLLVGSARERRHTADLDARERALDGFLVSEIKHVPGWAADGTLVIGQVVIASDYFKSFAAQLRGIVGGEVRSFQTLMNRARREALLRAVEQAQSHGGRGIINLRYETSRIVAGSGRSGMAAVEVLCYGTAVVPERATTTP